MVAQLPTSATPNMMDSLGMRLLQRISSSLLSAEHPSAAGALSKLHTFCRKVELSFDVLRVLEENFSSAFAEGNKSPVSRKKYKATTNDRRIDPFPFHSVGITIPTTDVEVRGACVVVLSQLKGILKVWVHNQ